MYKIIRLTHRPSLVTVGQTNDKKTALIAARVISLRDNACVIYVEKDGRAFACYGDAPDRKERKTFRYSKEKRRLLRGEI